MGKPHIAHDAVISDQEKAEAIELAFLRVEALGGCEGALKDGEQVVYRATDRQIHKGPLFVISSDSRTALIGGTFNDQPRGTQLRVMRTELVRAIEAEGVAQGVLAKAHPCSSCAVSELPGQVPQASAGMSGKAN